MDKFDVWLHMVTIPKWVVYDIVLTTLLEIKKNIYLDDLWND
jgi:hypothetical protein